MTNSSDTNRQRSLSPVSRPQRTQLAEGEIAPLEENLSLITPATPLDRCPTNLDLADPKQAAIAVNAMGIPDVTLDKTGRAVIKTRYVLSYGDWIPREDGTGYDAVIYTVLISKDGSMFKTSGVFGPRAARAALELFSRADWERGVTCVVTERQTAKGRRAHSIQWLFDSEDANGPIG